MFRLGGVDDGARSASGNIQGTYLHGAFSSDSFRRAWLEEIGGASDAALNYRQSVEDALDALADGVEAAVETDRLFAAARQPGWQPQT